MSGVAGGVEGTVAGSVGRELIDDDGAASAKRGNGESREGHGKEGGPQAPAVGAQRATLGSSPSVGEDGVAA